MLDLACTCGYPIRVVPESEWETTLSGGSLSVQQNPVAAYQLFIPRHVLSHFVHEQSAEFCRNTLQDLHGSGIHCPPIDQARMQLYLQYFARTGFLQPPPSSGTGTATPAA